MGRPSAEVVLEFVSPSDPAAEWTGAHKGPAFFAYSDNYLIECAGFGVIVDVEASRSIRQAEVGAARTLRSSAPRTAWAYEPERLVGRSTAYVSAPMLNWLVEKRASATYSRVRQVERDNGTFSRSDFRMIHELRLPLPGRKAARNSGTVHEGKTLLYRASKLDCDVCPLKPQCCPKDPSRKIPRDIHEHARDIARPFVDPEDFEKSRRERKKTEMRFAHLKCIL